MTVARSRTRTSTASPPSTAHTPPDRDRPRDTPHRTPPGQAAPPSGPQTTPSDPPPTNPATTAPSNTPAPDGIQESSGPSRNSIKRAGRHPLCDSLTRREWQPTWTSIRLGFDRCGSLIMRQWTHDCGTPVKEGAARWEASAVAVHDCCRVAQRRRGGDGLSISGGPSRSPANPRLLRVGRRSSEAHRCPSQLRHPLPEPAAARRRPASASALVALGFPHRYVSRDLARVPRRAIVDYRRSRLAPQAILLHRWLVVYEAQRASILQLARSLGVCSKRLSCCEWAFGWAVASLSSGWLLSRGAAGAFCAERGGWRCRLRAG